MACTVTYATTTEDLHRYLCALDHLPQGIADPRYGTVTWSWGRAQARCLNLDPDAKIPAWSFVPGKLGMIVLAGFPTLSAKNYLVRKSLIHDCDPAPPPGSDMREFGAPVASQPDPFPRQFTGGMIPVLAPEVPMPSIMIPTVPAPTAVPMTLRPARGGIIAGPVAPQEGLLEGAIGAIGGFLTGGPGGAVVGGLAGLLGTGGGESPTSPGVPPTGFGPTKCPTGYRWDGTRCVAEGFGGFVERILPGGGTGVLPPQQVSAQGTTMGAFGIPASMPFQVGQTQYGPILRCMAGSVLGKDNLCYPKGSIPNKHRKWPRGSRPLLTGGDMKTLRKIGSLQTRVKRAWASAGKPGNRPAPKPCTKHHHHK